MLPTADAITTIYESIFDAEGLEEGIEVRTSRQQSGFVDAVAFIDYTEGELLQAPIEVSLLIAEAILAARDRPLAPEPDSATVIFTSSAVPGLGQDGYIVTIERDDRDEVEAVIISDLHEDVEIVCQPVIAHALALAIQGLDAFPSSALN